MSCKAFDTYRLSAEIRNAKPLDKEKYRTKRGLGKSLGEIIEENKQDRADVIKLMTKMPGVYIDNEHRASNTT